MENKDQNKTEATAKPKKKFFSVVRTQNASTKEGKEFARSLSQHEKEKAKKEKERARANDVKRGIDKLKNAVKPADAAKSAESAKQAAKPVENAKPSTAAVKPAETAKPSAPVSAAKPSESAKASAPASAAKPSEPVKASAPAPAPAAKPAEPVKASAPAPAAKPSEPVKASAPAPAAKPAEPVKVSAPAPAAKPAESAKASAPAPAAKPAEPVKASAPAPAPAAKPAESAKASAPVPAAKPAEPVKASAPAPAAKPAEPVKASAPAVAAKPAETPKPSAPAASAQTENRGQVSGETRNTPAGDRPRYNNDRPRYNNDRNYSDRNNGDRNNGDRAQTGDRPRYNNDRNGQNRYNNDRPRYNNDRNNGEHNNGDRAQTGDRPRYNNNGDRPQYGDRPRYNNDRNYSDRNNGDRAQTGDRPRYNNDRNYSDRNNVDRAQTGDRPRYNNNGDRPQYGDRPRFNNNNGDRKPYTPFGGKDKDDDQQTRRPSAPRKTEHKPAGEGMDMGIKKPTRDNTVKKEKERSKDTLRENKFNDDHRPGKNNNQKSQQSHLPKALQKPAPKPKQEKKEDEVREITLPEKLTIRELADKMKIQPAVIIKKLFMEGIMVTVNHEIEYEKAAELAMEYNIIAEPEEKVDVIEELLKEDEEDEDDMVPRPPVICVMGHVDHGKTSLLDCIRNTHVTDREAGGITQHIGAYTVSINKQKITFLDTPGHEAFTAMRMRGANATDIAVLVVAADDGVMPQTIEAINHAKAAGVEIIVAVNKIDKPGANVDRVKKEMTEYGLVSEDWGGSTVFVPVSAKTHEGIEDLLEMILLTAEVMELKANPKRKARGLVIEAKLDKGKGPVATILVQKGTLHVGDYIAAGACSGKVRAMTDDKGRRVKEAGPSTPVEILGLSDVPNAGEVLVQTETDKEAKNFAATFISENKKSLLDETKAKMSLDDLFSQIQEGNLKELNIVVKADVQGSVEAVKQSLVKLSNDEVVVRVVHGGVGAINESDVMLASASNAIIIGFNVRPDTNAKSYAEQEGVDMHLYSVIYQAIEDVERAMKGMLDPIYEEKVIGHAEIRQIFKASGVGNIAGSYIMDGVFQRGCKVRISREGKQIYEGALASLKRFKDDVKEVKTGFECGLVFEGFNDIQELDIVEAYIMVEVPR